MHRNYTYFVHFPFFLLLRLVTTVNILHKMNVLQETISGKEKLPDARAKKDSPVYEVYKIISGWHDRQIFGSGNYKIITQWGI